MKKFLAILVLAVFAQVSLGQLLDFQAILRNKIFRNFDCNGSFVFLIKDIPQHFAMVLISLPLIYIEMGAGHQGVIKHRMTMNLAVFTINKYK